MKKQKGYSAKSGLSDKEIKKIEKFRAKNPLQNADFAKDKKSFAAQATTPQEFNEALIGKFVKAYKYYRKAMANKEYRSKFIKWCHKQQPPIKTGTTPLANLISQAVLGKQGNMASRNGQAMRILMFQEVLPKNASEELTKEGVGGIKGYVQKNKGLISLRKSKSKIPSWRNEAPKIMGWSKEFKDKAYDLAEKEKIFVVILKNLHYSTCAIVDIRPLGSLKQPPTPAKKGKLKPKNVGWE